MCRVSRRALPAARVRPWGCDRSGLSEFRGRTGLQSEDAGPVDCKLDIELELVRAGVLAALFGETQEPLRLGPFEIVRTLGRGAMGAVYEARDTRRGGRVALKLLTGSDGRAVYRLKREFRSLCGVVHPNLVLLHELFCEQGRWFFTMELVDGVPFDAWARQAREASDETTLRDGLRQLGYAVEAVQDAGKLHCDLKPSNVLVRSDVRVVVLDFGLVSDLGVDSLADRGPVGTPAFMAPEQAAGQRPTASSDWYAVGVMLFEALTGRLPFQGNPVRVLREKQQRDAPDPRALNWRASAELSELCVGLLRRDPRARLGARDVLRRAAQPHEVHEVSDTISRESAPSTPFVGRDEPLAALQAALETAHAGQAVAVFVGGRSGMGKSALLERFVGSLRERALVLQGRCHEQESVPYNVFDAVVDALSQHLRRLSAHEVEILLPLHVPALLRLFPVLAQVPWLAKAGQGPTSDDPRELRNQAFDALKELLRGLTARMRVVVVVDDLQWGDLDSARMLGHLLGPVDPPPMLLLGAYRSDEVEHSEFLREVIGQQTASSHWHPQLLELRRLSAATTVQLVRELLDDADPDMQQHAAQLIATESEGVPFFIAELAQHFRLCIDRGERVSGLAAIGLERVILERFRRTPQDAQRLLQVLSVAARPIEQHVVLEAAQLPHGDRGAILALRAARLIRIRGVDPEHAIETYHDRVRETVMGTLTPSALRAIHASVAQAMERYQPADAERLVHHYIGAGDSARAGETALRAAYAATQKLAFNRAVELYRKAIELLPAPDARQRELRRHLGNALANAGRGGEAATAYIEAADGYPLPQARRLRELAVQQYLRSGRMAEGTALAKRLFREVGLVFPETLSRTLRNFVWQRIRLCVSGYDSDDCQAAAHDQSAIDRLSVLDVTFREMAIVDPLRGAALQTQFLNYARRARDPDRLLQGLAWEAWHVALTRASPKPAQRILSRVERLAQQLGTPYAIATASAARAGCACFSGRLGDILTPADEAERLLKESCPASHWEQTLVAIYRYFAIEHVGGFQTIVREAPVRAREAQDRDDLFGTASLTLYDTFSNLVGDTPRDALRLLKIAQQRLRPPYSVFHFFVAVRTLQTLLYSNEGAAALRYLHSEASVFKASASSRGRLYANTMRFGIARCHLAGAKVEKDDRAAHLRQAARIGGHLIKSSQPHARAYGLLVLAETAWRRGNSVRASQLLTTCMTGVNSHQSPMFACYAQRALGQLQGGDEGAALIQLADTHLQAEGVRSPQNWTRTWIDLDPN